jgi:Cu-Zn family superoxide dismutase
MGFKTLASLGLALLAAAMAGAQDRSQPSPTGDQVDRAVALLAPTAGQQATGTVSFTAAGSGKVRVVAELRGLPPKSTHGFHVHEFGDCSAPDASSAGAHFSPETRPHGGPKASQRHAGDLGNVEADANGVARVELTVSDLAIATGPSAVVGRAVVLHAKPDDLETQPSGNSGDRVACGVIGAAKAAHAGG